MTEIEQKALDQINSSLHLKKTMYGLTVVLESAEEYMRESENKAYILALASQGVGGKKFYQPLKFINQFELNMETLGKLIEEYSNDKQWETLVLIKVDLGMIGTICQIKTQK